MISEHRAKAVVKLADLYGADPDGRVAEMLSCPATICRFMEVTQYIVDVGSEDPERSPFVTWHELTGYDDPWEPIELEEEYFDHDGRGSLVGVVDLDRWAITQRSVRGWDAVPLPA